MGIVHSSHGTLEIDDTGKVTGITLVSTRSTKEQVLEHLQTIISTIDKYPDHKVKHIAYLCEDIVSYIKKEDE
jgi:hypothetical protein